MERFVRHRAGWLLLPALMASACTTSLRTDAVDDERAALRMIERERLQSLVAADIATARRLHADDFQLITPTGVALSKADYLAQVETGQVDYLAWDPGEITVRLYGDTAMIRYADVRFDVDSRGQPVHRGAMFHTNLYERRGGAWQIVWSQASGQIKPPRP